MKHLSHEDRRYLEVHRHRIQERLAEFAAVPRASWPREVALCILTPQTSPVRAEAAMRILEQAGLFEGSLAVDEVAKILRDSSHYIRFHNTKARNVLSFVSVWPLLREYLHSGKTAREEREYAVALVRGFGFKEASHALRNIGRRGLVILDRHIVRELVGYGVIPKEPAAISPKTYEGIEERFREFAMFNEVDIDVLDLFFWSKRTGFIFK